MKPEKVYACFKDKDVRLSSSSGAVFSSLAEYVLNKNGIVYSVAMSADCYARCVSLYGDDFDSLFDDNFFDLLPGETKCIRVLPSPSSGVIYAETAYDQTVVSCQWKKEKEK